MVEMNAFSKGVPEHGGKEMSDQLRDIITLVFSPFFFFPFFERSNSGVFDG